MFRVSGFFIAQPKVALMQELKLISYRCTAAYTFHNGPSPPPAPAAPPPMEILDAGDVYNPVVGAAFEQLTVVVGPFCGRTV